MLIFTLLLCVHHCNAGLNVQLQENSIPLTDDFWIMCSTFFKDAECISVVNLNDPENNDIVDLLTRNIYSKLASLVIRKNVRTKSVSQIDKSFSLHRNNEKRKRVRREFCNQWTESFIIVANRLENLASYSHETEIVTAFWSERATFVVVIQERICGDEKERLKPIFDHLWRVYNVLHVVVCTTDCQININDVKSSNETEVNDSLVCYLYEPFYLEDYEWGVVSRYSIFEIVRDPKIIKHDLVNLNGYNLTLALFQSPMTIQLNTTNGSLMYTGVDGFVMKNLQQYMNFTLNTIHVSKKDRYGYRMPNGTFNGGLSTIVYGKAQMVCVLYFIKNYESEEIEFSSAMFQDELCVTVRKSDKVPNWTLIYRCFEPNVWLFIIILYLLTWFSWVFLHKVPFRLLTKNSGSQTFITLALKTLNIFTLVSYVEHIALDPERIFLSAALTTSLTIAGVFQGSLTTVYSTPTYYPNINTMRQLKNSRLLIGTRSLPLTLDVFPNDSTDSVIRDLNKMVIMFDGDIDASVMNRKMGSLRRKTEFQLTRQLFFYSKDGTYLLHFVKECPRKYGLAYILPKGSVISMRINNLLLYMLQGGLITHWYEEMIFNDSLRIQEELRSREISDTEDDIYDRKFSLEDLKVIFFILISGHTISIFIFFIELCIRKTKQFYKKIC